MANISGYLQTIKTANSGESVRDAIIKCMKDINEDSAIRATNLTITKDDNVTYTAPKGYAFKNVTVNIDSEGETDPNNTYTYEELSVTEGTANGTYPIEPRENFAYSKVIVDINWDAITGSIDREGTMNSLQTADDGRRYWDCNWDGHNAVQRVYIGEGVSVNLPDYNGSGTGQGSANGPFMVTFKTYDDKPILSKSGVPKGTYIFEEYPDLLVQLENKIPKSINGRPYSGQWTYVSSPIVANTTCKPIYNAASSAIGGDSLAKVMEDGGAHYAIGEEVLMTPTEVISMPEIKIPGYATAINENGPQIATFRAKNIQPSAFSMYFQIVAHGEGGTATTWLATVNCANILLNQIYNQQGDITYSYGGYADPWVHATNYGCDDALGCIAEKAIATIMYRLLPEEVKSHIVSCPTKVQYGFNSGGYDLRDITRQPNNYVTINYRNPGFMWLPSYAELGSWSASARTEHRAIDGAYIDSTSTIWDLDTGSGTIDYTLNGWMPRDIPAAGSSTYCSIFTRSTMIGHGRTDMYKFPRIIGLNLSDTGETIADRVSITFSSSPFGSYAYFGFCTT